MCAVAVLLLEEAATAQTFKLLHAFNGTNGGYPSGNGPVYANSGLVIASNTLYGTTAGGGTWGNGTVYKVNKDGSGFTNLYFFPAGVTVGLFSLTNSDGAWPYAGLALSSNILYGTTSNGGTNHSGTVFSISTEGTGFKVLHTFGSFQGDAATPRIGLVCSSNTLYGGTRLGGGGLGAIYVLNTDGTDYRILRSLATNYSEGIEVASLFLVSNKLYGTTREGPVRGLPFSMNTDGTGYTNGIALPVNGLNLQGNLKYDTAINGGTWTNGVIYAVNINGTGSTNLYSFSADFSPGGLKPNHDGHHANGVIISGDALYGTAAYGGFWNQGTVFSLSFAPELQIASVGTNVIITWPSNVSGFDYAAYNLQTCTNLNAPVWADLESANAVTNEVTASQQFFRLSK